MITISPEDQRQTHAGTGPSISIPCRSATDSTSFDAQAAFGGTSCYGAGEALHDRARRVYYERHGIHIGLISDGVRSASGQRNYVTCGGPPPGGIRTSTANRSPFV